MGVATYPRVLGEMETLDLVLSGRSLARYGDGEFKLCRGGDIKSQVGHPTLAKRLREILIDSGECLVGIPNLHSATPKHEYWHKQAAGAVQFLAGRIYGSAFVSRADSAPWINSDAYWSKVERLWRGRDVMLVRGSGKAFTPELMVGAKSVAEIMGPRQSAWSDYAALVKRIGHPDRVLLSLGPTATVLAVELCARGVHAIDVGHMGACYRRWLKAPEAVA